MFEPCAIWPASSGSSSQTWCSSGRPSSGIGRWRSVRIQVIAAPQPRQKSSGMGNLHLAIEHELQERGLLDLVPVVGAAEERYELERRPDLAHGDAALGDQAEPVLLARHPPEALLRPRDLDLDHELARLEGHEVLEEIARGRDQERLALVPEEGRLLRTGLRHPRPPSRHGRWKSGASRGGARTPG